MRSVIRIAYIFAGTTALGICFGPSDCRGQMPHEKTETRSGVSTYYRSIVAGRTASRRVPSVLFTAAHKLQLASAGASSNPKRSSCLYELAPRPLAVCWHQRPCRIVLFAWRDPGTYTVSLLVLSDSPLTIRLSIWHFLASLLPSVLDLDLVMEGQSCHKLPGPTARAGSAPNGAGMGNGQSSLWGIWHRTK